MSLTGADQTKRAIAAIKILRKATKGMVDPAANQLIDIYGRKPYLILISCLLSLRAKDFTTVLVSQELFKYVRTPQQMLKIPTKKLEKLIFSIGFYKKKARLLHSVSQDLIKRFGGKVPKTKKELLSIDGIGQKTANLVLAEAYGIPGICVDTHVHRVSNRLGLVKTKTADQTEKALEKIIPKKYWIELNPLFVMWGQQVCTPISPKCSTCAISKLCPKIGVTKHR